ncbi:MAG: type II CRISPR RNA-guided endonuclease Cas9 [Sphingopyxis sp.]
MHNNQNWRLGLDLGSNSLGWAALALTDEGSPISLIDMGVRIFSDGRDPQDQQSNAAKRRMPRGARRNRDRYLQRRSKFLAMLTHYGLLPADAQERARLEALDPWILRARGLEEALEPHEFGRALFHLQQRRGFQSNRLIDKDDGDKGKVNKGAEQARLAMGHSGAETLGQMKGWPRQENQSKLEGQRKAMPLARVRSHGEGAKLAYDYYPLREMIADEFDLLWEAQAQHHPSLTDEARTALREALLFQRPLKPQPVGRCTLEADEERAPGALPSVQRLRIYQELNNLRIAKRSGEPRMPLSRADRDRLAHKLETCAKLSLKQIRKELGLSEAASFNIEEGGRDYLDGNKTHDLLTGSAKNKAGWKGWADLSPQEQDALIEILLGRAAPVNGSTQAVVNTHRQIVDRVARGLALDVETAQSLVEAKDQDSITDFLCDRYGLNDAMAERVTNVRLPDGHGRLGRTAGGKVLPHLIAPDENGNLRSFDKAVLAGGYRSHSMLGTGEVHDTIDGLPYYGIVLE